MMSNQVTTVPRQWTREVSCPDVFMSISVSFPGLGAEAATATVTEQLFRNILQEALTELYGFIGGAVNFVVLQVQGWSAIVRVDKRDADKLWAAAVFATKYGSAKVEVTVNRASPFLISMPVDSRAWAASIVAGSLGS
ncbi:hypothetical protein Vretimale_2259 [Volvox reticuliferus]|uniref:Uncharacterized protein n=1 Tax=Volvox reticuliferus TaxID=1737510 RepID=A0A8J4C4M8_9CHLO|nr:hypothetical protein Vretifemale_4457 [Volvox reticuliferus]GIL96397.1 hypothetical protein Vretimale_2259 [Volvox reticuliferus]